MNPLAMWKILCPMAQSRVSCEGSSDPVSVKRCLFTVISHQDSERRSKHQISYRLHVPGICAPSESEPVQGVVSQSKVFLWLHYLTQEQVQSRPRKSSRATKDACDCMLMRTNYYNARMSSTTVSFYFLLAMLALFLYHTQSSGCWTSGGLTTLAFLIKSLQRHAARYWYCSGNIE